MDLVTLLNNLVAALTEAQNAVSALQAQLADAQAAAQAQYDKGFADGKASVSGGFTQADIDAAVAKAVEPLNAQIAALQTQVDGIPAQLDAQKVALKGAFKALVQANEADEESKIDAL